MRARYYPDTDTALIELVEDVEDVEGEEVTPGVVVHFDEDDRPVRIEIYERARAKLAGILVPGVPTGEPDDYLALAVGRAWLAGYSTGRSEERVDPEADVWRHGA